MTTRRRALLAALAMSALVLGIVMLVLADRTDHFSSPLAKGGVFLLLGWSFAGAGLAALVRRMSPCDIRAIVIPAWGLSRGGGRERKRSFRVRCPRLGLDAPGKRADGI